MAKCGRDQAPPRLETEKIANLKVELHLLLFLLDTLHINPCNHLKIAYRHNVAGSESGIPEVLNRFYTGIKMMFFPFITENIFYRIMELIFGWKSVTELSK
jgi:hypothetical protein